MEMESGKGQGGLLLDPETEFLAMKQETGNEWELFKENVRPLKRGRNVGILNKALKFNTDFQLKKSLLEHRRELIEAIDKYQGDDPLQPWIQCIKWVQEAFPPGGDCSGLVLMYEQCVRTFWHEERYKNDLRYLKVWLEYAENCRDAEVIYGFLEANSIGLTHSSFYIAYALHMESKNKIKTANEIFHRGMSMNAQPIEKLNAAYKKFLTRSMRQPKLTNEEDSIENNGVPVRSFGTILARGETLNRIPESSDLGRKKLKNDRGNNGIPLSIYKEKNAVNAHEMPKLDSKPWHTLGARAERNKENNALPTKWTANKIPVRPGHRIGSGVTPIPSIEIFVDEECDKEQPKVEEGTKSSILQLRHKDQGDVTKETDLLRENPLRNFPLSSMPR